MRSAPALKPIATPSPSAMTTASGAASITAAFRLSASRIWVSSARWRLSAATTSPTQGFQGNGTRGGSTASPSANFST